MRHLRNIKLARWLQVDKQRIGDQGKVSIFCFPWWIKTITAIKLLLGQIT